MHQLTVEHVHHYSERTFVFRTNRPATFRFAAGEFAMIGLEVDGKPILRAYSIASPPWADYLEFVSIKIADGALTSKLQHIQAGDTVLLKPRTTGTLVNTTLTDGNRLVMLATGTGIAPFLSLIEDVETLERWDKILLVHSVRNAEDLVRYISIAHSLPDSPVHDLIKSKLEYKTVVTSLQPRITQQIADNTIAIDWHTDRVMICGNMAFNNDVIAIAHAAGAVEGSFRQAGTYVIEKAFVD